VTTVQALRASAVSEFVAKFRLGSVRQELDTGVLSMTVEQALQMGSSKIRKLLTDGRFAK